MDKTLEQLIQHIINEVRIRESLEQALRAKHEECEKLKKELESVRNPDKKEGK